jgi:hypothetical protein
MLVTSLATNAIYITISLMQSRILQYNTLAFRNTNCRCISILEANDFDGYQLY